MDSENMKASQLFMMEMKEKLMLLKSNEEHLPVREVLSLAANIRDEIRNNKVLEGVCNDNIALANSRKEILTELSTFITNLIDKVILERDDFGNLGHVSNFDVAKMSLVEMIEKEQEKKLFYVQEDDKFLDGITECQTHTTTLCKVADNCKNGKFIVLIMGDFQSGKSTTIDAFCDGRHISAIGDGTATSAVLVSVSYAEKESLQVNWREKEQFMPIFERIQRIMPDYAWHNFDLDNSDERERLAEAIDLLRTSSKRKAFEPGDVKFLMLCDFILAYYGTEDLEKKKSFLPISSISEFTRFPKDAEIKWENKGLKAFTMEDTIFVFIESVACTVPSETLKRLNCTIIDSPGLFNSAYDTMVTESAMVAAHAIIYVLPYYKGIDENGCKTLYAIRDKYHDFHSKLFIINNLDSRTECAFAESNRQFVKRTFGEDKDVYFYDAKVSYLAQLKKRYDDGNASEIDYAHLMHVKSRTPFEIAKEIKFQTFDEAWSFHIKIYKGIYDTNDTSTAKEYLEKSGFPNIVSALKAFVEKNESFAVIMSNGIIPMRKELIAIRRELLMRYIEPYITSHEDLTNLWNERIIKAEKFQKYVIDTIHTELFHTNNESSLHSNISNDEYEKIFTSDFYSEIAKEIAGVLYDNKSTFIASQAMRAIRDDVSIQLSPPRLIFKNDGRFQEVFGDLASPLIKKSLMKKITYELKYVLEKIESEQDKTIDKLFSPIAKYIEKEIEHEWNKIFNSNGEFNMSNYLTIPRTLKGCVVETRTETSGTDIISDLGIGATLVGGIVVQITTMVTSIAAMIAGYIGIILCDPTFTALIVCVLLSIGGTIVSTIAPDHVRDRFVDFLTKRVEPKIKEETIRESFREIIDVQIKTILEKYEQGRVIDIQKMKNQRDTALSSNSYQEEHCFRAIELIQKIKIQVATYDSYLKKYVENETL